MQNHCKVPFAARVLLAAGYVWGGSIVVGVGIGTVCVDFAKRNTKKVANKIIDKVFGE